MAQYVTAHPSTALTLSSGGKSGGRFQVYRGPCFDCTPGDCSDCISCETCLGKGLIKKSSDCPVRYYPNWWKSTSACEGCQNSCVVGTEGCGQNLIDECPLHIDGTLIANSASITTVVNIVNSALEDVDDIDDETAEKLIALMKNAARR